MSRSSINWGKRRGALIRALRWFEGFLENERRAYGFFRRAPAKRVLIPVVCNPYQLTALHLHTTFTQQVGQNEKYENFCASKLH